MQGVYTYEVLQEEIRELMGNVPSMECRVIGKSVLNQNIYELRWGRGENIVHYNASFHANEWITSVVLMNWLKRLGQSSQLMPGLLDQIQISAVPMVNPDGVELVAKGSQAAAGMSDVARMNEYKPDYNGWKANIRGVDLNKQFPAHWEENREKSYCRQPYYRDYPGEKPLTEPEAIAMQQLVAGSDFHHILALHTQGKEFDWGYRGYEPEEAGEYACCLEEAGCYKAIQDVDSSAGFRDWFIYQYRKPGFTLELGKGMNPLPMSQLPAIENEAFPLLDKALFLGK